MASDLRSRRAQPNMNNRRRPVTTSAFKRMVLTPASAAAGQYRLVAEAIDGDEVAALEVMVHAATSAMGAMLLRGPHAFPLKEQS